MQALWALARHDPAGLARELGCETLLRVQQREGVRKAGDFGSAAAVRFARLTNTKYINLY